MFRAALLLALVVAVLMAMTGVALASDPTGTVGAPFTFTESSPETAAIPSAVSGPALSGAYGASAWTYKDASDATTKTEGSYRAFDDQTGIGKYTTNPHGGYSTTSNNCKTCHAVHRATGSFGLLRVDDPDDACSYCHIGSHRHANSEAYFGGSLGIYSANGHTIGAGKEIPDSSVWQWTENVTLTGEDGTSTTFPVRRYMAQRNKIMRYIVHGDRYIRTGPTYLRCSSCHQVHNATRQIWRPRSTGWYAGTAGAQLTNGYKLLRAGPSGGITVNTTAAANGASGPLSASDGARASSRLNFTFYDPGDPGNSDGLTSTKNDYRIRAVEATINVQTGLYEPAYDNTFDGGITNPTSNNPTTTAMGPNVTGYTPFKYRAVTNLPTQETTTMPIYETSMAFWCADCHNLNIAGKTNTPGFGTGKGDSMLGDRAHVIPANLRSAGAEDEAGTVGTNPSGSQCYMCHTSDMVLDARATVGGSCGGCHIRPQTYHYYKNGITVSGKTWTQRSSDDSLSAVALKAYGTTITAPRSDWPHSGPDQSMKLLQARDRIGAKSASHDMNLDGVIDALDNTDGNDAWGRAFDKSTDGIDKICKTCHGPYKEREIGYDK